MFSCADQLNKRIIWRGQWFVCISEGLKDTDVVSQIAAAGGIWTKGLATTFGSGQNHVKILNDIQGGLEVNIAELPGDHLLLQ